jgi:hypothetical protein
MAASVLDQIRADLAATKEMLDEMDRDYPLPVERPTLTLIPGGSGAAADSR